MLTFPYPGQRFMYHFTDMNKFFKGLKQGLEEALAYLEGKITLKSELKEIPVPPYKTKEIKEALDSEGIKEI